MGPGDLKIYFSGTWGRSLSKKEKPVKFSWMVVVSVSGEMGLGFIEGGDDGDVSKYWLILFLWWRISFLFLVTFI